MIGERDKKSIQIDALLYNRIKDYCQLNKLKINAFVQELLSKAFTNEQFGDAPFLQHENNNEVKQFEIPDIIKKHAEAQLIQNVPLKKEKEEEKEPDVQENESNQPKIRRRKLK